MKNYYAKLIFCFILITGFFACKKALLTGTESGTFSKNNGLAIQSVQMPKGDLITGFNIKWNELPTLTPSLISRINDLSPEMLRYPGGTITHKWNWGWGLPTDSNGVAIQHMDDVVNLAYNTKSKTIFVIDILNSTMTNQLNMLTNYNSKMRIKTGNATANYIEYIELGNEIYDTDYQTINGFKTGADYANSIASWAAAIKAAFPGCKIGVSLIATANGGNDRKSGWNRGTTTGSIVLKTKPTIACDNSTSTIIETITNTVAEPHRLDGVLPTINANSTLNSNIDAYIYHVYIPIAGVSCSGVPINTDAQSRIDDFEAVRTLDAPLTSGKEIWVTEYGNMNEGVTTPYDLQQLDILANYLHSRSEIKIALNHVIVSSGGSSHPLLSKLTTTGSDYTIGGDYFLRRGNPVVINKIDNSQGTNGAGDAVELLVLQNNLDMQNMILKKFGGNGSTDFGIAYKFKSGVALWQGVKSGTLIVIKNGGTTDVTTNPYVLTIDVNDTTYFTRGTENPSSTFNVANTGDMWMIKNPNFDSSGAVTGTTTGTENAIHTFAFGSPSTTFYNYDSIKGGKLYSTAACSPTNHTVYCINSNPAKVANYRDSIGTSATSGTKTLGVATDTNNATFISNLQAAGW